MKLTQPIINTLERAGIDYKLNAKNEPTDRVEVSNRFTGETATVHPLIAKIINWVYETNNAYERGDNTVKLSDFDRLRYFVLANDPTAYYLCLD